MRTGIFCLQTVFALTGHKVGRWKEPRVNPTLPRFCGCVTCAVYIWATPRHHLRVPLSVRVGRDAVSRCVNVVLKSTRVRGPRLSVFRKHLSFGGSLRLGFRRTLSARRRSLLASIPCQFWKSQNKLQQRWTARELLMNRKSLLVGYVVNLFTS